MNLSKHRDERLKTMYRDAKTEDDVFVILDAVSYINDVRQLANYANSRKNIVKARDMPCPFNSNIVMRDLSMWPKLDEEDEAFSLDP